MKLKHLLFGAFVALAVAACTKDNAGVTPENGDKMATADKYISINLKMPAGAATRAADTEATPEENAVKKATFLFFKDGSQVAEPFTIAAGGNDANNEAWTPGDGATKNPVIVMKNPTDIPTSLVVLINYDGTVDKSTNLNALQAEVADYSGTKNGFVMSNSVYNEASSNVIGAPVTSENIKETPEDAKANPVKVYVERVLAKVTIDADDALVPESGYDNITIDVDNSTWGLVYENTQSYLIKKLGTSYDYKWTWNDAANHRSYWAEAATFKAGNGTAYKDYVALGEVLYTQESTQFQTWTPKAETNPVAVVVGATLKYGDGEAAKAQDLFKFRGAIYTTDGIKTMLANDFNYYKKTSDDPATFTKLLGEDYELEIDATKGESYEAAVNLALGSSITAVYNATGASVDIAVVTAALKAGAQNLEYWNGGATYYYIPIKQHIAEGESDADVYGIVRNHFYKLNITKIQGLGTAVPDPAQVIIPVTPEEKEYYIAAEINILDWKLVEQNVDLGAE